nr:immunoglobulin light chain junction region [Macaca mulatta]MOX18402.1 immunoglobulin light chain junction region [Macaca mulatta]MOX19248.1 immunoglobulin light chain junction region [Macaca mulatta]MOX19390.1 immunoglobulin light chain junction region [Macaca mulatta]MOX20048.1 immunoglobulin light chain junction region [Macaca mulatta]
DYYCQSHDSSLSVFF